LNSVTASYHGNEEIDGTNNGTPAGQDGSRNERRNENAARKDGSQDAGQ
jgi:hypothetical protein